MSKSNWNADNIHDQAGKVFVITGATSGLGKEAARVLAGKNAKVVLAVRNLQKGENVAESIRKTYPLSTVEIQKLDLTSLESIRDFADRFLREHDRLDVLINNAGIMMCPYSKTMDGFEIQMGTNHLGHFALTGLLMPLLKKTKDSRIVVTSSLGHKMGDIDLSDINWESRDYKTMKAYSDSKLANLYFAYELARKHDEDPDLPLVTASHPGWTRTELQRHTSWASFLNNFFSQGVDMGTLPTLRAAVDPEAKPGDYFGPSKHFEMHGHPVKVRSNKLSHDAKMARRLWELSEQMTNIKY